MDSTYSQIIPEYDINKESESSNGQEMIPIGNDFEADVLLIQIHDHKMEKDRIIKLFEKETSHIKTWKNQEITKLDKKIQWLSQHLEVFWFRVKVNDSTFLMERYRTENNLFMLRC